MTTENVATKLDYTMRKSLFIKEVAKLVGVTTKTVRHYHKIGLLPEPERTESDYRLYGGWELWRLRTICELRRLGLSLERIRTVLEAPEPADALRSILATQLDELETEMVELAERKERIQRLMSQEHINVDLVNGQPDLYIDQIRTKYSVLIPADVDESLIQFEREFEGAMAAFPENDTRDQVYPPMMELIEQNPKQFQQYTQTMSTMWSQVSAIETLDPEAENTIQDLVDNFVQENSAFLQAMIQLTSDEGAEAEADEEAAGSPVDAVFGEMVSEQVSEQVGSSLTPAQMHLIGCLGSASDAMRKA